MCREAVSGQSCALSVLVERDMSAVESRYDRSRVLSMWNISTNTYLQGRIRHLYALVTGTLSAAHMNGDAREKRERNIMPE